MLNKIKNLIRCMKLGLTSTERDVLRKMDRGMSYRKIAESMNITMYRLEGYVLSPIKLKLSYHPRYRRTDKLYYKRKDLLNFYRRNLK